MTDYYEIAMGLKKPKTLEDKIKIEKKEDKKSIKKQNNIEILSKIRNNQLKLVENNLMIKDNNKLQLPNKSKFNKLRLPNNIHVINDDNLELNIQDDDNNKHNYQTLKLNMMNLLIQSMINNQVILKL